MPADPSIYSGVRLTPIQTPTEYETDQLQSENARLQQRQAAQTLKDQAAARQVFQQFGNDPEQLLPRLRTVAPSVASAYEKQLGEQRKSALESMKLENETQAKRTERGMQMLRMAQATQSPGAYQSARRLLAMDAEDLAAFPEQMPDPDTLGKMIETGASLTDVFNMHDKALNHFKDGDVEKGTAFALLSAGDDPEAWQEALQAGQSFGAGKAFLSSFGAQPTDEAMARARELTMTAAEKETARHNVAGEQNAAGQLAVSQGSLGVARGNLGVAQGRLSLDRANAPIETVIGPDGQPVNVARVDAIGKKPVPSTAAGGKLSAAQQDDLATMMTVEDLADQAKAIGDRTKWAGVGGMGAGSASQFAAKNFGWGTADAETLRNKIGNIQGTIAKLRGGTSFTPNEQTMLESYTPTINDSDKVIKAKLKSLKDFIATKRTNTLKVAAGDFSQTRPADGAIQKPIPGLAGGIAESTDGGKTWKRVQ